MRLIFILFFELIYFYSYSQNSTNLTSNINSQTVNYFSKDKHCTFTIVSNCSVTTCLVNNFDIVSNTQILIYDSGSHLIDSIIYNTPKKKFSFTFHTVPNSEYVIKINEIEHNSESEILAIFENCQGNNEIDNVLSDKNIEFIYPKIYPVPANNEIIIEYSKNCTNCVVKIFDVNGKLIIDNLFQVLLTEKINISALPNGIYTIQIINDKDVYWNKTIIKSH